ncbi:hypothetical protein [uncultured Gemmiger sp.]|uniref:hypothetical protein n=1 Tax=uncultured Gemmiger sp. TaxID=1623490 RepID=UPI0025E18628|nr:hypothetical protein [uncultured Gemmiger sp.]
MQNSLVPFDNDNLFDSSGHLTGSGLDAMETGRLDELGSLEAAEHLSFCNACLKRYTDWLEAVPQALLTPARNLVPQVQDLLRMRSIRLFTNKYVSIVAAILLTLVLWSFGVFGPTTGTARAAHRDLPQQPAFSVSQSLQELFGRIGQAAEGLLDDVQDTVQSGFAQLRLQPEEPGSQQTGGTQPARGE